tara:strand:+ start:246 stop:1565 length:1320 start_codon:yes stop_codon:yes gene_type:complete
MDLFDYNAKNILKESSPLASRMRPKSFDSFVGQTEIVGPKSPLLQSIANGTLPSLILWGPPGSGKTTLANLLSQSINAKLINISAVTSGVSNLRSAILESQNNLSMHKLRTILFIDEIHRFNKSQQDVILPYVENGTFTLIGATTENPSFEVIAPLLSRCRVFTLKKLSPDEISEIINRAIHDKENGLGLVNPNIDYKAVELIANMASGDARWALNTLELVINSRDSEKTADCISDKKVMEVVQTKSINYDKQGDSHYDTISAFIKSIRASDPDSAIYWLARMLSGGEDPMFIARRLIISASEDIGLADPRALTVATSAQHAVHVVGLPEGRIPLAEATIYLAAAPKSNSAYRSINEAMNEVSRSGDLPVPLHLRNPVTDLMKDSGYGSNYKYAHNYEGHFVKTQNMPEELQTSKYYHPGNLGFESRITDRLNMLWGKE